MADTTTTMISGKDLTLDLGTPASGAVAFEINCLGWEVEIVSNNKQIHSTSDLSNYSRVVAGAKDWSGRFTCVCDKTTALTLNYTQHAGAVFGMNATSIIKQIAGEIFIQSWRIVGSRDGDIIYELSFLGDGLPVIT